MSAWICSENHIGALARAYVKEVSPSADFRKVFNMLARENARSINARYGERRKAIPCKKAVDMYPEISGAVLGKQIACYNYQACEHDGWARSKARRCMIELGYRALQDLLYCTPEWESAPWGLR